MLLAAAAGVAQQPNLTIHATIKDMKAGNWIYWRKISDTDKDSVKTIDGGFDIRTSIAEGEGNIYIVQVGSAYTEHSMQLLYLDKGTVNINQCSTRPNCRAALLSLISMPTTILWIRTPYCMQRRNYTKKPISCIRTKTVPAWQNCSP